MADHWHHLARYKDQSWSTLWKTALVRLPRTVPIQALHITNPEGPQPFKLHLPSRQRGRTIPVYVFVPHVSFPNIKALRAVPSPSTFPIVLDFHGGGFYLGSYFEQAPFCGKLCRELHAIVITVDYRMAPLHKFPAAIEDAEDVTLAILKSTAPGYSELRCGITDYLRGHWHESLRSENDGHSGKAPMPPRPEIQLDTTRIAFSGASSGGNIALNMAISAPNCLGLPEWPSPIAKEYSTQVPLLLMYPSLDLRLLPSQRLRHDSMPPRDEHKTLDIDDHLAATYVSREMAAHPRASPGLVDTSVNLHKSAKILLILSGMDTLWEQSNIWVEKLEREGRGKDLEVMRFEERKHGWTTIPVIALSSEERKTRREVLNECVRFTGAAWNGQDPVLVVERDLDDIVQTPVTPDITPQDEALAELIDMGFPAQLAQEALEESHGSVESAVNWLLLQAEQEPSTKKSDGHG